MHSTWHFSWAVIYCLLLCLYLIHANIQPLWEEGSRPFNTPCSLFCCAVTSWLASSKSSGFSSLYNAIVLVGRLGKLGGDAENLCLPGRNITLLVVGSAFCYQETFQHFTPGGLMWFCDCWYRAGALPLPSPSSLEQAIVYRDKIDPSIDPDRDLGYSAALKPRGLVPSLTAGTEGKQRQRDGKG